MITLVEYQQHSHSGSTSLLLQHSSLFQNTFVSLFLSVSITPSLHRSPSDLYYVEGAPAVGTSCSETAPCGVMTADQLNSLTTTGNIFIDGTIQLQETVIINSIGFDISFTGGDGSDNGDQLTDILDLNGHHIDFTFSTSATFTLTKLSVINGERITQPGGGCIRLDNTNEVTIFESTFRNCITTVGSGGALYIEDSPTVNLEENRFEDCEAPHPTSDQTGTLGSGGAVFMNAVTFSQITGSIFSRNKAAFGAAATVLGDGASSHLVLDVEFDSHYSTWGGVVYYSSTPSLQIQASVFTNNVQEWDGLPGDAEAGVVQLSSLPNVANLEGLLVHDNVVVNSVVSNLETSAQAMIQGCTRIYENISYDKSPATKATFLFNGASALDYDLTNLDTDNEGLIAPVKVIDGTAGFIVAHRDGSSSISCSTGGALAGPNGCKCGLDDLDYALDPDCECPPGEWMVWDSAVCVVGVVASYSAECSELPPEDAGSADVADEGDLNPLVVAGYVTAGVVLLGGIAFLGLKSAGDSEASMSKPSTTIKSTRMSRSSNGSGATDAMKKSARNSGATEASEVQSRLIRDPSGTAKKPKKAGKGKRSSSGAKSRS